MPLPGLSNGTPRNLAALLTEASVATVPAVVMTPDVLLGLVLGGSIGAANAAVSYGLYRLVRGRSDKAFYSVVLLGLLVRLAVALALVVFVLVALPVHFTAFVGALLASVVAGLLAETLLIYRGQTRPASGPASSPSLP